MTWPAAVALKARRIAIVCFDLRADRVNRQPWAAAAGIARGLELAGHTGLVVTDSREPVAAMAFPMIAVSRLFRRRRFSPELLEALARWAPERVILVTGPLELARLEKDAFHGAPPVSLLLASPRSDLSTILQAGLRALWRERSLAMLPVINAILPGYFMRRGFVRSRASGTAFQSRAAARAYVRAGLPAGPVILPRVEGPITTRPAPRTTRFRLAYFGPPLALRGAYAALEAFEQARMRGLEGELLLLIRPDANGGLLEAFERRVMKSPARSRILLEIAMLPRPALAEALATAHAFLLPFILPVSDVPLVVIEAGLSGRPVITLDAPGVGEINRVMKGIVATDRVGLVDAIFEAQARAPFSRLPDPGRWTDWRDAVTDLLDEPSSPFSHLAMLAIAGVDGAGKTTIANGLAVRIPEGQREVRRVWSRFRNYLSKPLLALARLTGHNRKEVMDDVKVGYHDFTNCGWLAWSFILLQTLDQLIDIRLRFRVGPRLLIADRCVVDTLVDLAVDTAREEFVFGPIARILLGRLPAPLLVVVLRRSPAMIGQTRADALLDRNFARRRALYDKLAARYGFEILDNEGSPEQAIETIERLAAQRADAAHHGAGRRA